MEHLRGSTFHAHRTEGVLNYFDSSASPPTVLSTGPETWSIRGHCRRYLPNPSKR